MPTPSHAFILAFTVVFLGGCCGDPIRDMASLKDVRERPHHRRERTKDASDQDSKSSVVHKERDDDDDDDRGKIETGSIRSDGCQGAHIAYQATKEYLKNFGPKPPDEPGDKGPCAPGAH